MATSRSEMVRRFTLDSIGAEGIPSRPREMSPAQVAFITKMVMSELAELASSTKGAFSNATELRGFMQVCLNKALDEHEAKTHTPPDIYPHQRIADQADALGDIAYYVENAAIKTGIDLEPVFREIHAANERKRFPDGKYHRNAEGKVVKPPDWKGPDIVRALNLECSWPDSV